MSKEDEIRIVAVGKTGGGKSTLGNALIGDGSFIVGEFSDSETTQTTTKEGTWNGLKVKYADTPGLFDTKAGDGEVDKEIGKCVEQLSPGPDVVFYVINLDVRFTNEELKSVDGLNRIFGDDVTHYMIVVFTHRKSRSNRAEHEKKYIERANTDLKTVLHNCSDRYNFIYHDNETDSESDVDKIMELACRLKKVNNNKHYDSRMYDQAVKQVKEQQEREADEKAAKEKKEKELDKKALAIKVEKERLKIERAEDKRKQLKLEHQRLQERDRDQRERLICQLQLYRSTLSNYDIYTEKVRGEFNHVLIALTEKSKYDRIGQVGSSIGNIATSTGGVVGALTGPIGVGVMFVPTFIGTMSSAYFKITSGTLQEKVCDNSSDDDDKYLSNISTEENKILDMLRNLGSKRLESDITKAIDSTIELKYRLQTLLENNMSGINWKNELTWLACHTAKSAVIGIPMKTAARCTMKTAASRTMKTASSRIIKTASSRTMKTAARSTMKTAASRTMKTASSRTMKTVASRTMKTASSRTVKTVTNETVKKTTKKMFSETIGAATFGVGLFFDVRNIYNNTLNYKEPEIIKTLKMRINECDKTRDLLRDLMSEIDHVITKLTNSNPGA